MRHQTTIRWLANLAAAAFVALTAAPAHAQSNVRAWSAAGQVFVVWQVDTTAPLTYDIYRSATPITAISQGTLAGRMFEPEWSGARLRLASPNARWSVPTAKGGVYTLAANEGLFVFTPRAQSTEYFAVVRNGNTTVSATNRTPAPVVAVYDPVNQPVTCHL